MTASAPWSRATRLVLTVVLTLLALWLTIGATLASIVDARLPNLALKAYPFSATARAVEAASLITPSMSTRDAAKARTLARDALALDPTSVVAARSLGVMAEAGGDQATAGRLRDYALYLSRRDLLTQLWAIETAVAHNDIATALTHYDQALLTSNSAEQLLLPVLVAAAGQDQIRGRLLAKLKMHPIWWPSFTRELFTTGTDRPTIVSVFRLFGLGNPGSDAQRREFGSLGLSRLIALGDYADAWALVSRGPRDTLVNGDFEQTVISPPFGWQLVDEIDLSGVIQPGGDGASGYALFPSASGGRSGDAATQLVVLGPGRYTLSARSSGGFPAGSALIARCHGAAATPLGSVDLPARPAKSGVSLSFTVPANGCGGQVIAIRAASGDGGEPQTELAWIDAIKIKPGA